MSKSQPLDHLDALAKAGVPIIHVCGSLDPWLDSQTRVVEKRYKELGGRMSIVIDEGKGHEPTAPRDAKAVVEMLIATQKESAKQAAVKPREYHFDGTISREVLVNYLSRSISMEGLLNGRGDLEDNIRMLKTTGAKFIGRSLCLWGGEGRLIHNLETGPRANSQSFTRRTPTWSSRRAFSRSSPRRPIRSPCRIGRSTLSAGRWNSGIFGMPTCSTPDGQFVDHWRSGNSVPDVSRPETKLWFFFLAASFIDAGIEAVHFGQTELMNHNDRDLAHYSEILALIRTYAKTHARRHMLLCDSHVPSGGLVRDGRLLMDFHSFPLRIKEVAEKPGEAILEVGFSDGIYGRSKGGTMFSGWSCEHLPYLVELDNWGSSRHPGQAGQGSIWVWGYDEITWFAHQSEPYRAQWLRYAWDWVRATDPNGTLEMPGSRTMRSPLDGKRWYYANRPGPAVPDGLNDEAAIRAIWETDSEATPLPRRSQSSPGR